MRWFSTRRSASPLRSSKIFRGALFAVACLAGVGFSAGDRFEARAGDDGGMMSFLLSGNGGGRARAAAPAMRFDTPSIRSQAPAARRVAGLQQKARAQRAKRLALASKRTKQQERAMASVDAKSLIQKASFEQGAPAARPVAEAIALKAAAAAARPEDAYLRDKTLRPGDIVATSAGLRVFLGSDQFPHRAKDFAPVASARNIVQRSELAALDRSLRGIRAVAALVKAPLAKPPAAVAGTKAAGKPATPAPQTVAMAYAPKQDAAAATGKSDGPAVQALERVVRRIDAPAARTFATAAAPPSIQAVAPTKRLE